jgi:hypothetical protein
VEATPSMTVARKPGDRLSNAHIFFVAVVVEDGFHGCADWFEEVAMEMEFGLGRFGDRRLEKGGQRCMRPWFDGLAHGSGVLQGTAPRRFGSRAFCAMRG